jgi:hypothetical protein
MAFIKITEKECLDKAKGIWSCRCNGVKIEGKLNDVLQSCKLMKVTGINNPERLNELTHFIHFDLPLMIELKNSDLSEW